MFIRIIILLLCIYFIPFKSASQKIFDSEVIELRQGLKDRIVKKIARDAEGYFYFIQKNGIQQWDGKQLLNLDLSSIASFNILDDLDYWGRGPNGRVVLANTDKDIQLYQIDAQKKTLFTIDSKHLTGYNIFFHKDTAYASKTQNRSTYIYQLSPSFEIPSEALFILDKALSIKQMAILDDNLVIQNEQNHIYEYKNEKLQLVNDISGLLVSDGNGITAVANNQKLWRYENDQWIEKELNIPEQYFLKQISSDHQGNILIAFSNETRRFKKVFVVSTKGELIDISGITEENNKILNIYADNYLDKLILGSYNGVYYYNLQDESINDEVKRKLGANPSDFGNIISGLVVDKRGDIYLSGEATGLYKYNISSNILDTVISPSDTIYGRAIELYYDEPKDRIITLSYKNLFQNDCVYITDISTGKTKVNYIDIYIRDVAIAPNGKYAFIGEASHDETKNSYRKSNCQLGWIDMETMERSLAPISVELGEKYLPRDILFAHNKAFISSNNGLVICNEDLTEILHVVDEESTTNSIALKSGFTISCRAYKKKILVNTLSEGIYLIDPQDYSITNQLKEKDGLIDDAVFATIVDEQNNIWLGGSSGLSVIDSNFNVIRTIYQMDGLSHNEFSSGAAAFSKGRLFFGTNNGITRINPTQLLSEKHSTGLAIKQIDIVNQYEEGIISHYADFDDLYITANRDSITIHLDWPDYIKYSQSKYDQYVNLNIDGEEQSIKIKDGKLKVGNFKLGVYKLEISNRLNDSHRSINIHAQYNFLQNWGWYLAILLIGLLAYLISKKVIKRASKSEKEKTAYHKKITELRLNALKSQMNPHFIFNSLGAIQYFIQTQDTKLADEYLGKFAKLMRLILESSKSDYISVKDEMELMNLYVDLERVRFDGMFEYEIIIDDEVDSDMPIPPMIVQPLVENAINHGLYNLSERKGYLLILVEQPEEDLLKIHIRDNGVGRKYPSKNKKPHHKSRGMEIIRDRIGIINDKKEMEVGLHYTDLEQAGKALGTEVIVTLNYHTI